MKKPTVEILARESYLACIQNSVGTKLFQEYYARVDGKKKDVVEKGDKSCALYVSSVLKLFGLIGDVQLTVHRTLSGMEHNGWVKITRPKVGCVIVWKEKEFGAGNPRKHIGFYIGKGIAISNSSAKGVPTRHPYTSYKGRGIEALYAHPLIQS